MTILPIIHSAMLRDEPLVVGFTGKPLPTGGAHLSLDKRQENRQQWCQALRLEVGRLCVPQQVHGHRIVLASEWPDLIGTEPPKADAVWLRHPGEAALIQTADCVPVVLYAPDLHQAMVIHAGWQGTAQSITRIASQMLHEAGADYAQLKAVLGPSISGPCYEVGSEVVMALSATVTTEDGWLLSVDHSTKPHVDVKAVNRLQLLDLGVLPTHIETLNRCTYSEPSAFWSHRQGDWQRQGVLVQLA